MSDIQSADDDAFQARTEELMNRRTKQRMKAAKAEVKKSLGGGARNVSTSEDEDVDSSKQKPPSRKRLDRGSSTSSFTNSKASSSKRKKTKERLASKNDEDIGEKRKPQPKQRTDKTGGASKFASMSDEEKAPRKQKGRVRTILSSEDECRPGKSGTGKTEGVRPSDVFPESTWPPNMTKAKVDKLTIGEFQVSSTKNKNKI